MASPVNKRRGPLSPEEMIDLRNEQLRMDEEMVHRLVEEAKADYGENLLEPIRAFASPVAVMRHRRRCIKVMGDVAQLANNGKATLLAISVTGVIFAGLLYSPVYPWYVDLVFSLIFGAACTFLLLVHGGYRLAFTKVYALERRDFTDPSFVTGWVRVFLTSLAYYYRPDVWRGNDGKNGVTNPDSFVVLSCGLDEIEWTYDPDNPDWDADEWCTVTPGPRIQDFRSPLDYYDLPADKFTTDAVAHKHRRAWCRDILRNGGAYGVWERGSEGFLDGKWPWLLNGGMLAVGFVLLLVTLG